MRRWNALGATVACTMLALAVRPTKTAAKGAATKSAAARSVATKSVANDVEAAPAESAAAKEAGPPENRALPPLTSDELTERARHLFDAVVRDEAELAEDFFFPREPFLRLKDVSDPARYHAELVRMYRRDVHLLHARRRTWDGARFLSFELGSPPRWVKPGEEWNKIGYHRTFGGKLRYDLGGSVRIVDVHTIISWDGRWYVTHLSRTKR
jgi:hypothetical protein